MSDAEDQPEFELATRRYLAFKAAVEQTFKFLETRNTMDGAATVHRWGELKAACNGNSGVFLSGECLMASRHLTETIRDRLACGGLLNDLPVAVIDAAIKLRKYLQSMVRPDETLDLIKRIETAGVFPTPPWREEGWI